MLDKAQHRWGLYVSIPFCRFKCTYCNFASAVFPAEKLAQYLDALCWEISRMRNEKCGMRNAGRLTADTIYFGGGTPSMLTPGQLGRVFAELRRAFDVAAGAEITLEAAPGSISDELTRAWRACGVNRASLGVQSFVERELRAVGRPHRADTVAADVVTLRAAGIANISVDVIAGLPYQTAESWEASLEWLARLRPEHASVYMLEIDGNSRLGAEALATGSRYSAAVLPGEDAVADFYCRAVERLAELGYRQYEISNVALPGWESRHNLKYWSCAPYLGFGLDAHSFNGAERWANTDSLEEYVARAARGELPVAEREPLDPRRRAEERLFLGLRRNEGVELSEADAQRYRPEIDELAAAGLLEFELAADSGRLRLTGRGRLLSNEVFAAFLE